MSSLTKLPLALLAACFALGIGTVTYQGCRRQPNKQAEKITERRAASTKADQQADRAADSAYFFLEGRRYEHARQLDSLPRHAENIVPLPAIPDLPRGE